MDDIKLYARTERDIDSLKHLTRIYSKEFGMSFGRDKCGRMITKRGKVITTEGVEPQEGTTADVKDSYRYQRQMATIRRPHDIERLIQWLEKAGLEDSTGALIMAAQEQALSTWAIEAASETVQHIVMGCKMQAGTYMERHNQVARIVYRNICDEY